MRKTVSTLLIFIFILMTFHATGATQISGQITSTTVGKVVEVFDADAIAVRLFSGQIAYVKLLGVNAATREGGLKYMQDNAFGRNVTLIPDYSGSVSGMDGRWNRMYVYLSTDGTANTSGREFFNQSLIRFGYAEADSNFSSISQYSMLQNEQKNAKSMKLGMWGEGHSGYYASSDRVNINTASRKDFETYMTGSFSDMLISDILSYRSYAVFCSVDELKYVKGMTREFYSENKNLFTVITNINTASERELKTLDYEEIENVDNILKYRSSHTFDSLNELYTKASVYRDFYDRNRYYMSVKDGAKVTYAKPQIVVNINTASERQLADISDVGSGLASKIVGARRNGYTLKTLMELKEIGNIADQSVHKLSDNCNLYTDVNTATANELESLFGSAYITSEIDKIIGLRDISNVERLKNVLNDERYNRIIKFVYAGDKPVLPERVNLNTASDSQLREIGMSYSEAGRIISAKGRMWTASQIPIDVSAYDKNVALYTNINTASAKELRSLNVFSESTISQIISSRDEQPFGSNEELEEFFEEQRLLSSYKSVRDFIVVR